MSLPAFADPLYVDMSQSRGGGNQPTLRRPFIQGQDPPNVYDDVNPQAGQANLNTSSPCHNSDFYGTWLIADPMFSKLVFKHLCLNPFTNNFVSGVIPAAISMFCAARLSMHDPDADQAKIETLTLGEMLAPIVPTSKFLLQQPARAEFVLVVRWLIANTNFNPDYIATAQWREFTEFADAMRPVGEDARPAFAAVNSLETAQALVGMTPNEASIILCFLARSSPRLGQSYPVGLLASIILAVTKQGNASNAVIQKIKNDVARELGVEIDIMPSVLSMFHTQYGRIINANNIGEVFTSWTAWIPPAALRLALLVQQAAYSGLTSFCVTGKAIRLFQDFNWPRVAAILTTEMSNFLAAVDAVGGNVYYGFNADLGPAKSTHFKSLTWVAKELLIRVEGLDSLRRYRGWISRPKYAETLEAIIQQYIDGLQVAGADREDAALAARANEAVRLEINANVFV